MAPELALITGASSGIGAATAKALAEQGTNLVLLGRREDRLHEVAKACQGVSATVVPVDIRDRKAVTAWVDANQALVSQVDLLVNNAGLALGRDVLHESDPDDIDTMVDTNLKALLQVTRLILPHMVAAGRGHVVNLGSITGRQVYKGGTVYAATKFGVRAVTESLRHDLMGTNIRVTSIDPGMVETEFSLVRFRGDSKAAEAVYEGFQPLRPEDIADAIAWCATRPAHVNVQEVLVMPTAQPSVTKVERALS